MMRVQSRLHTDDSFSVNTEASPGLPGQLNRIQLFAYAEELSEMLLTISGLCQGCARLRTPTTLRVYSLQCRLVLIELLKVTAELSESEVGKETSE